MSVTLIRTCTVIVVAVVGVKDEVIQNLVGNWEIEQKQVSDDTPT